MAGISQVDFSYRWNELQLATAEYNFFIITGPNMSGKTIYLKMIALLQILAQIGCFVPATSAEFRMCDKLFTRMGFNDNIEQDASSFIIEVGSLNSSISIPNLYRHLFVLLQDSWNWIHYEEHDAKQFGIYRWALQVCLCEHIVIYRYENTISL